MLDIHRERITSPRELPEKCHEGKCSIPEKGMPSYKIDDRNTYAHDFNEDKKMVKNSRAKKSMESV